MENDAIVSALAAAERSFEKRPKNTEEGLNVEDAELVQLRRACRLLATAAQLLEEGYYTVVIESSFVAIERTIQFRCIHDGAMSGSEVISSHRRLYQRGAEVGLYDETFADARRYLEQEYLDNPDSRVVEVVPYYDLDENHRLDLAALDADGAFVVTVEVERINHDVKRAVPEDYDKMAGCDPDEAIWVVMSQSAGHDVLEALNEPPEGPVRVKKSYARTTPPQNFQIDTPGLTAIYPVEWLKGAFLD